MKINFILPAPGLSGGVKVVIKYAELFTEVGNKVILYFPICPYDLNPSNKSIGHKLYMLKKLLSNFRRYLIRKDYLKKENICLQPVWKISDKNIADADVSIATAWPTASDVMRLSENKGKRLYFVQDFEVWDDRIWGEKSYQLPLKKIVIANWIKESIEKLGIDSSEITVINNGIDVASYEANDKVINYKKPIKCLMLSHIHPKKGVREGLQVFEAVKKKYPDVSLTMFGMLDNPDIPDFVNFIKNPTMEELRKLYFDADIFIYPSLVEGWGLTVIEAMCAKCAVVGTNTGCLIDIGNNGNNALISKPGDINSMVNNIIRLIENRNLLARVAANGYKTVKDMNWNTSRDMFLAYLMDELKLEE